MSKQSKQVNTVINPLDLQSLQITRNFELEHTLI